MPASPTLRKVRVLHLIHTMAYGGVETAVLNWIRAMDQNHFEMHLACFANPGETERPFVEAAQRMGLTVAKIPWNRRKPLWRASTLLAALLRERKIDIVHSHNCYADVVTLLASWRVRVKTVTTAYVWFDYRNWKRDLLQWIDACAMRRFDCVTAHCENTRLEGLKRGFNANEVRTLICGFETHRIDIDAATRRRERLALGASAQTTVLINVARFYPEKAQVFLLECFALIAAQRPRVVLWLAGVGPLEAELRVAVDRLGLAQSVRFLGFVVDLPRLLALADIQVHPAHIEGVPLAICEGMAAGLPIVASEVGGLPEILDHGANGILVPGLAHDRFAAEVVRLVDDPRQATEFGIRARRFIENDYSLRTAIRNVEATYRELVPC
jgi:glycosyltransferase involved in cell wall biosynthesis